MIYNSMNGNMTRSLDFRKKRFIEILYYIRLKISLIKAMLSIIQP